MNDDIGDVSELNLILGKFFAKYKLLSKINIRQSYTQHFP